MLDKDKVILVVHVGVKYRPEDAILILDNVQRSVKGCFDESIKTLFVPDYDLVGINVECINPVLVDEELYKEVEEKTEKVVEFLDNFLNKTDKK